MMDRRALLWIVGTAAIASGLSWFTTTWQSPSSEATTSTPDVPQRIISLSPAVTETLYALGGGGALIARTDYCDFPPQAMELPSVGSGFSPDLEAIVRLQPDHILTDGSATIDRAALSQLAPTTPLPWLTLDDVTRSITQLGTITGRHEEAQRLVREFSTRLTTPAPANGPRTLLLLNPVDGDGEDLWFVRPNSIHGRVLHAAGSRNAIEEEVQGAASLSMEGLLRVDPDVIIALVPRKNLSAAERRRFNDKMARFGNLRAVQNQAIGFLAGPEHYATGPRILDLIGALRDTLSQMSLGEPPT
jgi:iron complex transport system substrate-binding protein